MSITHWPPVVYYLSSFCICYVRTEYILNECIGILDSDSILTGRHDTGNWYCTCTVIKNSSPVHNLGT